ncbi:MAG: hypothetical protein K2Q01_08780, partial [Rickettsiales bacterium]|nr:hypothetical protein [Rickettsiales bacterium]
VKLKPGSVGAAHAWASEISARKPEARKSLAKEGITLEAAFLDHINGEDYLFYVMRGDVEGSKEVARTSIAPIDLVHQQFKTHWEKVEALIPMIWVEREA